MPSRPRRIAGLVLTALLGLFLIGASGIPKFVDWPGKSEMNQKLGIPDSLLAPIGVVEIAATLLFLIPRTSFLGAVLLTGYLGGAILTHVRIGDPGYFPVIIGVLVWTALGLRRPAIFQLAFANEDPLQPDPPEYA